jgi:hypothetical protein
MFVLEDLISKNVWIRSPILKYFIFWSVFAITAFSFPLRPCCRPPSRVSSEQWGSEVAVARVREMPLRLAFRAREGARVW